jgi:anion-transporting  ArsA/GET3 family ATPase
MTAAAPDLLQLKLVFVTGKGGVGKTTVAAALAQLAAVHGQRVLACEVDAKGDLAALFEAAPTGFVPKEIAPGVASMSMDTEASLREYLKLHLRIPVVGRIGPLAKAFDFVATAAPGVREILTVGKLCYEVREGHYDLVVVDASASGHIIGQLAAPQAINDLVKVGLIRSQTDWMLDILSDPQQTGLVAVTTTEEMPVNETLELRDTLAAATDPLELERVILNGRYPDRFSAEDALALAGIGALDPHTQATVDVALAEHRRAGLQDAQEQRLRTEFGERLRVLPYLFERSIELPQLERLAMELTP